MFVDSQFGVVLAYSNEVDYTTYQNKFSKRFPIYFDPKYYRVNTEYDNLYEDEKCLARHYDDRHVELNHYPLE